MDTNNTTEVTTTVKFKPIPEIKKVQVTYSFSILSQDEDEGHACYIPGFDVYFFANTQEEILSIGRSMLSTYFDFWIKNQGYKAFFLELNKIGFRTENHTFAMQKLLNRKKVGNTKFKLLRGNVPSEFLAATRFNQEADFAVPA